MAKQELCTDYHNKTKVRYGMVSKAREIMLPRGNLAAQRPSEQIANGVPCCEMDEGRKRVLLIAAAILAARKLSGFEGGKRVPATVAAISDAVRWAEEIMREIDRHWPVQPRP